MSRHLLLQIKIDKSLLKCDSRPMLEKDNPTQDNNNDKMDWNDMVEVFEQWLPYIQPVAEVLIDLADISENDRILDVAAGTGEPSLTLARRYRNQNIDIIGVDSASALLKQARRKAEAEQLSGLRFQEMQAEDLNFQPASFDRVISRFGLMLFDNPLRGLEEMRRVLRHQGKLAVAVWGEFHKLPTMTLIWDVLMKAMPPEKRPEKPRISNLGRSDDLEALFKAAGFEAYEIKSFDVPYHFDDFESYWSINTNGGLLEEPLNMFSPSEQEILKKEVEILSIPYQENGHLIFQNESLLVLAEKT